MQCDNVNNFFHDHIEYALFHVRPNYNQTYLNQGCAAGRSEKAKGLNN